MQNFLKLQFPSSWLHTVHAILIVRMTWVRFDVYTKASDYYFVIFVDAPLIKLVLSVLASFDLVELLYFKH